MIKNEPTAISRTISITLNEDILDNLDELRRINAWDYVPSRSEIVRDLLRAQIFRIMHPEEEARLRAEFEAAQAEGEA